MRPVVMLAPFVAPSAWVGARRPTRFARHLPACGWRPIVLSLPDVGRFGRDEDAGAPVAADGGYVGGLVGRAWWAWESFKEERRRRAASAAPGGGAGKPPWRRALALYDRLVGDPTAKWEPFDEYLPYVPGAARRAARLARERGARVILASGPPFSVLVAGVAAARRAGVPAVLDLRDPWTLNPHRYPDKPAPIRALERAAEGWCLAHAARVILNTESARDAYAALYPAHAHKLRAIPNGFDRSAMRPGEPWAYPGFTLVHFGAVAHTRSIVPVLEGLACARRDARLVCYGRVRPQELDAIARAGLRARLDVRPRVPYGDSLRALDGAGALLVVQGADTAMQVPAKLYDALMSRPPIVAVSSCPDIDRILARTGRGLGLPADDPALVTATIRRIADGEQPFPTAVPAEVAAYDAPAQARALAEVLAEARG